MIKFFLMLLPITAFSHPHMTIYSSCEFVFEGSDLRGFWVEYQFDRYFTSDMIYYFDENNDSQFDEKETEEIYNTTFLNLEKYGFYISIRKGKTRFSPDHIDRFSVYLNDQLLSYRFYIEYSDPDEREIFVSINDPTYFTAIYMIDENPITFSGFSNIQPYYQIVKNNEYPLYYNPFAPIDENTTYFRWEPGLQTFYPDEIHLVY